MKNIWVTSDLHFGHKNIIKYCDRPYKDTNHMNEALINNYNSLVAPDDEVYNLGDVCMGPIENIDKYVPRLNGNVHLIVGNHDEGRRKTELAKYWPDQKPIDVIEYNGINFYLVHNKGEMEGDPNRVILYGHVHDNAPRGLADDWTYHVGVDTNAYMPVNLHDIWNEVMIRRIELGI